MKIGAVGQSVVVLCLSACGTSSLAPSADQRPVPLEAVLNQMKCELAMSFTQLDQEKLTFDGWFIDGKLSAKIITSEHAEGSVGTPELVPLGSGVSAGFSLSGSVTRSRTLDTILDFAVSPIATNIDVCRRARATGIRHVDNLGIYDWLYSITQTAEGEPRMAATNLTYTLDFGVSRTGSGGVDVAITAVKVSAKASSSRDDIQQLALTLSPGDAAKKHAREVIRESGKPGVIHTGGGGDIGVFVVPRPADAMTILDNDSTMDDAIEARRPPDE